jgi:hypothetical protein
MLKEFGGPLGGQAVKKHSLLETEIDRARLENGCKGALQAEVAAAGIVDRKRDAKAEEKEAEQKSSSSPLKELVH